MQALFRFELATYLPPKNRVNLRFRAQHQPSLLRNRKTSSTIAGFIASPGGCHHIVVSLEDIVYQSIAKAFGKARKPVLVVWAEVGGDGVETSVVCGSAVEVLQVLSSWEHTVPSWQSTEHAVLDQLGDTQRLTT